MSSEHKTIIAGMLTFSLTVLAIAFSVSHYYATIDKAAIEAGYTQEALPGKTGVYWVKK